MSKIHKVDQAQPFDYALVKAYSGARFMYIRQWRFPYEYDERDLIIGDYSDRVLAYVPEAIRSEAWKKWGNNGSSSWIGYLRDGPPQRLLNLLKGLLGVEREDSSVKGVRWTGFRITGVHNVSSGYLLHYYELYHRRSRHKYPLYSTEHAPNVQGWRMEERYDQFIDSLSGEFHPVIR